MRYWKPLKVGRLETGLLLGLSWNTPQFVFKIRQENGPDCVRESAAITNGYSVACMDCRMG